MANISDLCHKPITEMPLDELGYILLKRFSEQGPLISVYTCLIHLRDGRDEESRETSYNIMLEAFQWLCNEVKCIRLFRPQFRKFKIRFAVEIP